MAPVISARPSGYTGYGAGLSEHKHPVDPDAVPHVRSAQLTRAQGEDFASLLGIIGESVRAPATAISACSSRFRRALRSAEPARRRSCSRSREAPG